MLASSEKCPRGDAASDTALLGQIAAGDANAVGVLYDRYAAVLLPVALRVLAERGEAEDALHDTFVAVSGRAAQFAPERGSVIAWLVTMVRNLSIDRVRRRVRHHTVERARLVHEPWPRQETPEEATAASEVAEKARRALSTLPVAHRSTLETAFFEGLSYPEIAEREGVPLGTVKSRAARAILLLRGALEAEHPHAPGSAHHPHTKNAVAPRGARGGPLGAEATRTRGRR